ncbi:hypothetical protein ACYPKM_01405 [Pseudomonas aeruginosa]
MKFSKYAAFFILSLTLAGCGESKPTLESFKFDGSTPQAFAQSLRDLSHLVPADQQVQFSIDLEQVKKYYKTKAAFAQAMDGKGYAEYQQAVVEANNAYKAFMHNVAIKHEQELIDHFQSKMDAFADKDSNLAKVMIEQNKASRDLHQKNIDKLKAMSDDEYMAVLDSHRGKDYMSDNKFLPDD